VLITGSTTACSLSKTLKCLRGWTVIGWVAATVWLLHTDVKEPDMAASAIKRERESSKAVRAKYSTNERVRAPRKRIGIPRARVVGVKKRVLSLPADQRFSGGEKRWAKARKQARSAG